MLLSLCAAAILMPRPLPYKSWGFEALAAIQKDYLLPDGKLYADALEGGKPTHPAFNWGVGVMLTALNGAARLDPAWRPRLRAYVDATRVYWNDKGPVPGYDVLPGPKDVDRYYDDNQWMVMALVEASEILNEPRYLNFAKATLKYVLSGEDDKLGGGIYWHEPKKDVKNTCSNAPAAAACLAVYAHTRDKALLDAAKRLYAWTKKTLRDPADGLYWDGIKLDGSIDKTKWSYNTALMIRTADDLFAATKEKTYLDDAHAMAKASVARWVDPVTHAIKDEGRFAHLLIESWLRLDANAYYGQIAGGVSFLHAHGRDAKGRYGKRFDAPPTAGQTRFELIDQAAAARAYFTAAGLPQN